MSSKNTPAIIDYAVSAAKENEMKIFNIITLMKNMLSCFIENVDLRFLIFTHTIGTKNQYNSASAVFILTVIF